MDQSLLPNAVKSFVRSDAAMRMEPIVPPHAGRAARRLGPSILRILHPRKRNAKSFHPAPAVEKRFSADAIIPTNRRLSISM
jgi:hypothetical protein